ncbi:protein gar2-like [Nicotiana sylvestris]|uniref:protein gar2-like n=1 Tax=Nicotiana sylvestris TaxID=4096 RepID=UPI00388CEAB9
MRPAPPGEEVAPKPAKDKKRRRSSPSDALKPKKSKARKSKNDSAALYTDVAQKLRDEEEEGEDAGCELVPLKRGSVKASKITSPVMVEETHPRTEEISEEKGSAQAKRIEELEAKLAEAKAEVEKMKITADKSIAMYLADVEATQTQLREASDRERWSNDLAKCQSRRETLEEIHARGFNLSKEIAQANVREADARLFVSSDDDDDNKGNQGGSDNDNGPKGEVAPDGENNSWNS